MSNPLIDELGNRYGNLTVIEKTKDKNNRTAWLCKCDCGNTIIVRGPELRRGKYTTCGQSNCNYKKARNGRFIDETGKVYNHLTVLRKDPNNTPAGRVKWICQCDCVNKTIISIEGEQLRQGHTKSCGCMTKQLISESNQKDITNQRFGKLVALYSTGKQLNQKSSYLWHCICDCGQEIDVPLNYLTSGNTKSCGCLISQGEEKIKQFLQEKYFIFSQQYTFQDLKSSNNKKLRFDFAIFSDLSKNNLIGLIEFQGQQHYQPIEHFGGEQNFLIRQKYDQQKREYCEQNNIPLLEIKYDENNFKDLIIKFLERIN